MAVSPAYPQSALLSWAGMWSKTLPFHKAKNKDDLFLLAKREEVLDFHPVTYPAGAWSYHMRSPL